MADDAGSDVTAKMLHLSVSPKRIRLISSDDHEFIVREEVAYRAPTIVAMMKGPALGSGECHLTRIPSHILSIIVRYLHYKEINPSVAWPRDSPPAALDIPSSLRSDVCYAADFLGLVSNGPSTEHVRLISDDGHEFILRKEIALQAGTIRAALCGEEITELLPVDGPSLRLITSDGRVFDLAEWGRRAQIARYGDGILDLLDERQARQCFSSLVLRYVINYLNQQKKYEGSVEANPGFPILPEVALFLMTTADFLQC